MKRVTFTVLAVVAVALPVAFFTCTPLGMEKYFGPAPAPIRTPFDVSDRAKEIHRQLFVVDLHADSIIWSRDLLERSEQGHLDIPRMIDGNIGLQTFMAAIEGPFDPGRESIEAGGLDQVVFLALLDRWPLATHRSVKARALHVAQKLRDTEERSGAKFTVIESQADLARYVERRRSTRGISAGILGIEGAEPTEYEIENIDVLFDAGYRMMELAHYTDTPFAGSSSGAEKHGLTPLGKQAVRRMEELGMVVDVAHASPQAVHDVLDIATKPLIASHIGVRATCEHPRNLEDAHLDRIAANGGVIGIGFFKEVTCADDVAGVVRSIRYVSDRIGAEHVALGSGFDAPVAVPFDAAGMVVLTDALLKAGFTDDEVSGIMGDNMLRLFLEVLPSGVRRTYDRDLQVTKRPAPSSRAPKPRGRPTNRPLGPGR